MKAFFTKIKNFISLQVWPNIKKFFNNFSFKDWLLLIVTILCIIFFFRLKYVQEKNMNNALQYHQEMQTYENKIGEQYQQISSYIVSLDELKKSNTELADEVNNLKKLKPVIITKTETKFQIDTVYAESIKIVEVPDSAQHELYWQYDKEYEYYAISGVTSVKNNFSAFNTRIDNLTVNSDITLDVVDNGSNLSVLVRSHNPYVNVTGMQSVSIDPTTSPTIKKYFKQKHWGIGPSIGVGVDKNLHFTPYIGISLNYNILTF